MPRPVAISLFAGVGGFCLGLEAAGFDIVTALEIDPIHAATHHFNFPRSLTICSDIKSFEPKGFKQEVDLINFGSPCQSFSLIGKQDPNDERSTLSLEALRIILSFRPKYFLMENVPAIALSKNVHILQGLIEKFEEEGYKIVRPIQNLNAKDFGVPQNRNRLFLIGYRADCPAPKYPEPELRQATVADNILDLAGVAQFVGEDKGIDAQIMENHRVLSGTRPSDRYSKCHVRGNQDKVWGHLGSKHSEIVQQRFSETRQGGKEGISRFHKLDPEGVCLTLRAGTAGNKGAFTAPRPIHYSQNRCITIREAARLHGYPDWFQFNRTIHHGQRQIGNSVCPPVAKAIGEEIIKVLNTGDIEVQEFSPADEGLLNFDNTQAANYFCVPANINGYRTRKRSK